MAATAKTERSGTLVDISGDYSVNRQPLVLSVFICVYLWPIILSLISVHQRSSAANQSPYPLMIPDERR
jgi:hypothetical protein